MVGMIADYARNGVDEHNSFLVSGTDDFEAAVNEVARRLESKGYDVSCITVCPGVYSLDELDRLCDCGAVPGHVYFPFIFD